MLSVPGPCNGGERLGYKHVFGLLDSNNLRNKEIPEQKTHREGFKEHMTANGNTQARTTSSGTNTTGRSESPRGSRASSTTIREGLTKTIDWYRRELARDDSSFSV